MVRVFDWFTHLELEWNRPGARAFLAALGSRHQLVRYDLPGMGLSDRDADDFGMAAKVRYLETVVDAVGLERFALLGQSVGGPTALAYTAKHPERVTRLALYGSYALCAPDPQTQQQVDALATLIRGGRAAPGRSEGEAFRVGGMADEGSEAALPDDDAWRTVVTPEAASAIYESFWNLDVTAQASAVTAPTLVIHRREDDSIPFDWGRRLAGLIPSARFLPLEGKSHAIRADEPEGEQMVEAILGFLAEETVAGADARGSALAVPPSGLTKREVEVLRLLAQGEPNREIAQQLSLSVHTVNRHVANIYHKIGARGRADATAYAISNGLV